MNEEKVRDLKDYIIDNVIHGFESMEDAIADWFEKNPIAPVPVGLSDEQIDVLAVALKMNNLSSAYRSTTEKSVIDDYLKTQTFEQPKSFEPNWDDAPNSVSATVLIDYRNENGNPVKCKDVLAVYFRPKPLSPVVEVGQIWRYKDYNYIISSVGKLKIAGAWLESVCYKTDSGIFYTRTLSDFLAKFERVGGE